MSNARAIICAVVEGAPFDVKDWILNKFEGPHRIVSTYHTITPESSEQGDYADSGWEDEEGVIVEPDEIDKEDGITVADKAADFLWHKGATEMSSSDWHEGMWYSTGWESNYRTGEEKELNYHLRGFSAEEEREVHDLMRAKMRRR